MGVLEEESSLVVCTGDWPQKWDFRDLHDVQAFCAFVYEQALAAGAKNEAAAFRSKTGFAWPATELVLMLQEALTFAHSQLSRFVREATRGDIERAQAALQQWLRP
jgi:hypothetical protein